jgi:hypothetical protein
VVELEVRVTVPPSGCQECVLSYVEGLQGSGQPVLLRARTVPGVDQPGVGRTIIPATESLTFRVCGGGVRVPGDCNEDGSIDISDGICLLGFLFLGAGPLPCGDGGASDTANLQLLDGNGDGGIDLSDAVRLFQYLFAGGPPHVLGAACITIPGCPAPAISPNCDGMGP